MNDPVSNLRPLEFVAVDFVVVVVVFVGVGVLETVDEFEGAGEEPFLWVTGA